MATGDGGEPAKISYPYSGGAGGKFRKKPFRKQTTPYDRLPSALCVSNINNSKSSSSSSWLTKLVVEPASKLISYGADRFFGSVLQRRLVPPPKPQSDIKADVSDAICGEDHDGQDSAQEAGNVDCRQPINSLSGHDGVQEPGDDGCGQLLNSSSELEQLFKQKTFSRSEIGHLAELLQSRAVDGSLKNVNQRIENGSEFGRHRAYASGLLNGNITAGIRSSTVVSTPVRNSKVLEDDIATPAELAKAYMGSKPSKVSPSELRMHGQLSREEVGLPFASKSPIMSLTKKGSMGLGAPNTCFVSSRSRSRSAIYNMARTPYSRVHPASAFKFQGSGSHNDDYARPSTSLHLPPVDNTEKLEPQPVRLKRSCSVVDDEVVSVGPVRRIRQKSNLVAPRLCHTTQGVGVGSLSKQKHELMGDRRNNGVLKNILENNNQSVQCTSYARVPSRSSEVAAKILQQLEKLSPKEKSSQSKLLLKSTPDKFSVQVLKRTEDVGSSKLHRMDVQDDCKLRESAVLYDARDSSSQKQAIVDGSQPKRSVFSSVPWNSLLNNESAVTLRASNLSTGTTDLGKNAASQSQQKKIAFRTSAEEESSEQDDMQYNGLAPRSLADNKGPTGSLLMPNNHASDEEHKLVKTTSKSEDKLLSGSGFVLKRKTEASDAAERTSDVAAPASEETRATSQPESFVSSFATFDKPKEANNSPLFGFSLKVSDKFPPLPAESTIRAEAEPASSSRIKNISKSSGSQVKTFESDECVDLNLPRPGYMISNNVSSAASNGTIDLSFCNVLFPTNRISTGSAPLFSSSLSITNCFSTDTSTSTTASGSHFGSTVKPCSIAGPAFKFGSSVEPSAAVSAQSTLTISKVADQRTKDEINPTSRSSTSSHPTENNLQGSLFGSSNSKFLTGVESVSQCSSSQLFSTTSAPSFNLNTSTFLCSSPSPTSSFSSSSLSSSPNTFPPASSSLVFRSEASASPGTLGFAQSSSSSTPTTVAATPPGFNCFGTSSAGINTGSSLSSGPSGNFNLCGESQKSPIFGSTLAASSAAPSTTGFAFGATSTSNYVVSPSPAFPFATSATPSTPPLSNTRPTFGNCSPVGGSFSNSPGYNMLNTGDRMVEDPTPSSASPAPVFGQSGRSFGSTTPSQTSPFLFSGQVAPQNQATGSLVFNAGGGSFSLGSGGVDKSSRKIIRVNRNKNRKN